MNLTSKYSTIKHEPGPYNVIAIIRDENALILSTGVFYKEKDAKIWCFETMQLMQKHGLKDIEMKDDYDFDQENLPTN
jgi:hypothetical protein